MGAAALPATRPSATPEHVAVSFIHLYYRVAARMPGRLAQLYGDSSELNHGEGLTARGEAIAKITERLPIAGCQAAVKYLSVQATGTGAYVVVVLGTYDKGDDEFAFSQTFILENQIDSHKEHFFCRNDIFTPQNAANELGASVARVVIPDPEQINAEPEPPSVDPIPAPVDPAPPAVTSPVTATKTVPTVDHIPAAPLEAPNHVSESRSITDISTVPVPDAAINGSAVHVEPEPEVPAVEEVSEPSPPVTATPPLAEANSAKAIKPASPPSPLTNGPAQEEPHPLRSDPVPPTKKTWASIVSKKEAANGAANGAPPVPVIEHSPPPSPAKEQSENIPPPLQESTSKPPQPTGTTRHTPYQNGPRPPHHGHVNRNNHQRVFGPSAVVQLSALSPVQLQDPRGVANKLREEFSNYGFKLRNVDVKAQKGIAFVEYETLEGVKAAVTKWAAGARTDGPFAGVALQVSEKRPSHHGNRRPGSIRGGRGGPRAGRRPRPNSTPLS